MRKDNHIKISNKKIRLKDLIEYVAEDVGCSDHVASKVVQATLDRMVKELEAGSVMEFRGYFSLGSKVQRPRMAQNPKTLEKFEIPARRVPHIKFHGPMKSLPLEPLNQV